MKPTNRQVENDRCAWAEAEKYLALSYDELAKIERAFHAHTDHPPQWVDCCGQEALADIRICKLGLFRPRITVEVILTGGGDDSPRVTSIVYFQRFRSGRLNVRGPAPVPHKYDRKRHNREEGRSQAEAPGETIMTDDEILSVIDAIHDRWFSVEDIEFDPAARTWSVPFSVGPTMRNTRTPR